MKYNEATDFLLELPDMERSQRGARARTMSLEAMKSLLKRLGNPELGRCTVHVTGSKGKGSTSVFLASMLGASSSTSLYTSPHLHSYRERICLDLNPLSPGEFAAGVASIKDAVTAEHLGAAGPISTFGAMTALFFNLSRTHRAKWQVVEVGMGGLHDASNVFDRKELVIITAISLEHTNMLGKSTLEIAENKAGIIRPNSIVVLAPQKDRAVADLIRRKCAEQGAALIEVASQYKIIPEAFDGHEQNLALSSACQGTRRFKLKMLGEHQLANAATAIAAVDALHDRFALLSQADMNEALQSVFVPGRLELVNDVPRVVIDGAHNGESAAALVSSLKRHFKVQGAVFVVGVNSDKNIREILEAIKPVCSKLVITRSSNEKAMDPLIIAELARSLGLEFKLIDSAPEALEQAMQAAGEDGLVCATGSLYLVAEVREYFLGAEPSWSLTSHPLSTTPAARSPLLALPKS